MKLILIAALLFLSACAAPAEKKCVQRYFGDSYALSYDGCIVSMEKIAPATDFDILLFKSKSATNKVLLSIYQGGAPDVDNLRKNESEVVKSRINGLQSEILERFDERRRIYKYEALIALPEDSQGRVLYLHAQHEGVLRDDLKTAKTIVESIMAK
jgi:hypothetical protein